MFLSKAQVLGGAWLENFPVIRPWMFPVCIVKHNSFNTYVQEF